MKTKQSKETVSASSVDIYVDKLPNRLWTVSLLEEPINDKSESLRLGEFINKSDAMTEALHARDCYIACGFLATVIINGNNY